MPYGAYRGDPGFLGALGKIAGGVLGVAGGILPGPVGTIAKIGAGVLRPTRRVAAPPPTRMMPAFPGRRPTPFRRMAPPVGAVAPAVTPAEARAMGMVARRRRMNYGNTRALTRASRRIDGFVKVARRALKHTNYKVVSKSAGRAAGSRGVITRREAARALRV